eukprot:CAMPEP_0172166828 /NCGR_PEP_ID=MMETSP1050-20130122/9218_1 /TAXON_ID=233186 /ORGANISM="Cryptomonas curvata, Strain CCAP979/52" /LENGTH=67 /DNA_ID=CAMNT_0012837521 /DNA_START=84 /DNA_END=287 /DNA_ORIENTATION=+
MLELSLSRPSDGKWESMPEDESFASPCNLISSLERPSFDLLDYINWCKFLDWDMKAVKQLTDENAAE